MLLMSIDPTTGRVAAASVPRDTDFFPRARSNRGGSSGIERVNSMYYFYRKSDLPHGAVDGAALARFTKDISAALGVEIDGFAMIRFCGFVNLVNALKGLTVDVAAPIVDPYYRAVHGVYFPARDHYKLKGNPPCADEPFQCHSALAYARSRKGTVGSDLNGDFPRARRQQELIMSAVSRVLNRFDDPSALAKLVRDTRGQLWTNLPRTLAAALQLASLLSDATLGARDSVVFGPRKWAFATKDTPLYTYRLNVDLVRGWIDEHIAPLR